MHRSRQRALIPLLIVVFVGGLAGGYAAGRQVTQWIVGTPCGQGAATSQRGLPASVSGGRGEQGLVPPGELRLDGGAGARLAPRPTPI